MISKPILKKLIKQRIKDAEALISKRCYYSSIYLGGYAIELALKYKICQMYKFYLGFPETSQEFIQYYKNPKFSYNTRKKLLPVISKIKQIKSHNLPELLEYSGEETKVKEFCTDEWFNVFSWNPDFRYKIMTIKKEIAVINLSAVKTILKTIKV